MAMLNQDTHVIEIQALIREIGITADYPYLMNRARLGKPARELMWQKLRDLQEGTVILTFNDIQEVSLSVAEELGPILFQQYLELHKQRPSLYLAYANLNKDLLEGWERIFQIPDKPLICCVLSDYTEAGYVEGHFFGYGLPDALRTVLEHIYQFGWANSNSLTEQGIAAASRKLNAVFNDYPWLVQRRQILLNDRAWTYDYRPIALKREEVPV